MNINRNYQIYPQALMYLETTGAVQLKIRKKMNTKESLKFDIQPGLGIMDTWQHFCFTYEVSSSSSSGVKVKMVGYLQGTIEDEGRLSVQAPNKT